MKTVSITLFLVIFVEIFAQETVDINKSIATVQKCFSTDTDAYSKCLLNFWMEIRPLLKKGIPELNIPQMDPAKIPRLDVSQNGAVTQGDATFSDIVIRGISNYVVKNLNVDPGAKTVSVELFLPQVDANGNYVIHGTVMLLPINGNGTFVLNLSGINGKGVGYVERDGTTGLRLAKLDIDFSIKNMTVYLSNLFGGGEVTDAINKLINDNSQAILADVKPEITSRLEKITSNFISGLVKVIPADYFVPSEGLDAPTG